VLTAATKLQGYMKGELNVWDITVSTDESKWCTLSADPNNKLLGKRFGKGTLLVLLYLTSTYHDRVYSKELITVNKHIIMEFIV
jgi:hypothetical protein